MQSLAILEYLEEVPAVAPAAGRFARTSSRTRARQMLAMDAHPFIVPRVRKISRTGTSSR